MILLLVSLLVSTLVSSECVDAPNWGCEDIEKPEYCNGLQMKKCLKACGQCAETQPEQEETKPEKECTETFEPVCKACTLDDDCDGHKFSIETRGEGQKSILGCTYPKSYEFVNSGDNCPDCSDVTCDWKITGGKKYTETEMTQTGCYGVASHEEGEDDDFNFKVVGDEVTVTKHRNPDFVGAVGKLSETDGVKTITWGSGQTYTCGGEEEHDHESDEEQHEHESGEEEHDHDHHDHEENCDGDCCDDNECVVKAFGGKDNWMGVHDCASAKRWLKLQGLNECKGAFDTLVSFGYLTTDTVTEDTEDFAVMCCTSCKADLCALDKDSKELKEGETCEGETFDFCGKEQCITNTACTVAQFGTADTKCATDTTSAEEEEPKEECADVTCDWTITGGKAYDEASATQDGCTGVISHVKGESDDFDYKVEGNAVTVTKHPNAKFVGAVGEYSEADGVKTIQWGKDGPTYTCGAEPETPEPEPECKDKVDELRSVLYDEEATCASAIESYGDDICSNDLFSPYCCETCKAKSEKLADCTCGIGAVKGEEKFQQRSVEGSKMCEFGANCAAFFEGCDAKGATICALKIEYAEETVEPESKESPEPESEESEEPEATCSMEDCLSPCKGRGKRRRCVIKKDSMCADKKRLRKRYWSRLACRSKSQTLVFKPAEQTASWTAEDLAVYGFALVGLVASTHMALVLGKRLKREEYELVEVDQEL